LKPNTEEIFLAGGCLWGVQEFVRHLPGVCSTEAGRANGTSQTLEGGYDGYAECVRITFDAKRVSVARLIEYLFEIIDPYSIDQQGPDKGRKYRTGVYSRKFAHLKTARSFIAAREDAAKIAVEVLPLSHYLKSAPEHQDRLSRFPEDSCHLPKAILHKYRTPQ
jgi:peptide-methionine (S)-S-oxide reductase